MYKLNNIFLLPKNTKHKQKLILKLDWRIKKPIWLKLRYMYYMYWYSIQIYALISLHILAPNKILYTKKWHLILWFELHYLQVGRVEILKFTKKKQKRIKSHWVKRMYINFMYSDLLVPFASFFSNFLFEYLWQPKILLSTSGR